MAMVVVGCVGKSQHLERYRLLSCADGPIMSYHPIQKRPKSKSNENYFAQRELFQTQTSNNDSKGDMQCV